MARMELCFIIDLPAGRVNLSMMTASCYGWMFLKTTYSCERYEVIN